MLFNKHLKLFNWYKYFSVSIYFWKNQKQPSRDVLKKRCSEICSKFTRENPCRSVISIKLQSTFIEITLSYGCSPVNSLHIFRTPFLKNISGRLLLKNQHTLDEHKYFRTAFAFSIRTQFSNGIVVSIQLTEQLFLFSSIQIVLFPYLFFTRIYF